MVTVNGFSACRLNETDIQHDVIEMRKSSQAIAKSRAKSTESPESAVHTPVADMLD